MSVHVEPNEQLFVLPGVWGSSPVPEFPSRGAFEPCGLCGLSELLHFQTLKGRVQYFNEADQYFN